MLWSDANIISSVQGLIEERRPVENCLGGGQEYAYAYIESIKRVNNTDWLKGMAVSFSNWRQDDLGWATRKRGEKWDVPDARE